MNLGLFSAYNGFIDTFRSMLEEWLESSCSAVIWGLFAVYMKVYGTAGTRVYPGRFTLLKSDLFSQKAIAVQRTRHSAFGTLPNYHIKGGGG